MNLLHMVRRNPLPPHGAYHPDMPAAHIYINPASIASVIGRDHNTTRLDFIGTNDFEIVEGHVTDVVAALHSHISAADAILNSIDDALSGVSERLESLDNLIPCDYEPILTDIARAILESR